MSEAAVKPLPKPPKPTRPVSSPNLNAINNRGRGGSRALSPRSQPLPPPPSPQRGTTPNRRMPQRPGTVIVPGQRKLPNATPPLPSKPTPPGTPVKPEISDKPPVIPEKPKIPEKPQRTTPLSPQQPVRPPPTTANTPNPPPKPSKPPNNTNFSTGNPVPVLPRMSVEIPKQFMTRSNSDAAIKKASIAKPDESAYNAPLPKPPTSNVNRASIKIGQALEFKFPSDIQNRKPDINPDTLSPGRSTSPRSFSPRNFSPRNDPPRSRTETAPPNLDEPSVKSPESKKKMKRVTSVRIFSPVTRKKTEGELADIERSMSGELVVKGGWEKPGEANSLTKKLQKEAERMEKEKQELNSQSKTYEEENHRLIKWRKMLERIQEEDVVEIRKLEEEVSAASKERDEYARRVKILEDQCNELLGSLESTVKNLKHGLKK